MAEHKDFKNFDPSLLYEYDSVNKTYILNLSINSFKKMYNTWDYSPYRKRDINETLIKYIEDCSAEIPLKHKMSIHMYLPENEKNENQEKEGISALKYYFKYLLYKKVQQKSRYLKNAMLYGLSGFLFLTMAYIFQKLGAEKYYLPILPDGLFIGGWVLFWEVFSIIFFRVREISQSIKEYYRLSEAEITYHFGKTFPKTIKTN
ncbi:MAG: hypothetical protein OEV78_02840 [Spirochaetia bacterium]|nr:hypothetical protein [Spirochaetia bacterium]